MSIGILSCASKKDILYFQDVEVLNLEKIEQDFDPIIETNDILYITISSMNEEVLQPFLRNQMQIQQTSSSNPGLDGYLVHNDGTISFPVLGDLEVGGKSRDEIETILKEKLSQFVKDVVVDVRIMNFEITVIGEVKMPGIYTIKDERVTLPEALALAGDLTEDGKRSTITIVREENGVRKVAKIDYTQADFFNSPYYFLKQNDLVYVEPSKKGVIKTGFVSDVTVVLSIVTVILSSIILITNI